MKTYGLAESPCCDAILHRPGSSGPFSCYDCGKTYDTNGRPAGHTLESAARALNRSLPAKEST